jgi:hypothetical protein
LGLSPKIIYDVPIKKTGVKDKNGSVSERGDILMAFIYSSKAIMSNGRTRNVAIKKTLSSSGISMKGIIKTKKGTA